MAGTGGNKETAGTAPDALWWSGPPLIFASNWHNCYDIADLTPRRHFQENSLAQKLTSRITRASHHLGGIQRRTPCLKTNRTWSIMSPK